MPFIACDKQKETSKPEADYKSLKTSLQNAVEKIIEKEDFLQHHVEVKDFKTLCDNFLGKLYEINIKGRTSKCQKEINLFVKEKIILNKVKVLDTEELYAREKLMYKELSKTFISLQDKANIPLEDRFKIAKVYDETSNDFIILENLCKRRFRTLGKGEPVSLKFVELGVQELAKFHALSFIIESKMPEYFKEMIAGLESPFHFDDDWKILMQNVCSSVADLHDDKIKQKIKKYVPVLLEKLPKYHNDKTIKRALSHGDYKKNNVMVRLNDGEPVEVIPVDYQFIDYGCPMRDLLVFIFSGTEQEFRRKHLNDLKELYFQTLSKFLKYFDMDVETIYPREEFEKVYTEWLDYGLMTTLYLGMVLFTPDTELSFENISYSDVKFCPDKKFYNTLRGLIDDFVQWGYL